MQKCHTYWVSNKTFLNTEMFMLQNSDGNPSLFPISNEMIYSFLLYNINLTICDSLKEKCAVKCNVNILKQDRNKLPMVHNGHDIIHSQITKISRHLSCVSYQE